MPNSTRAVDLRSDTLTTPTSAMLRAMNAADVGDDVYGEDPSVRALEVRTAEVLGKEEAVYMPTGTMSNQVGLRIQTQSGDQVLVEAAGHVFTSESGAAAMMSGVLLRQIPGARGVLDPADIRAAIPVERPNMVNTVQAPTTLLCLENTHNFGGGTVWPLEALRACASVARDAGLSVHLDGARIWNASIASGDSESAIAACADTVSVCFSKGLGAPVGSALAGPSELMRRARRFRQAFGGGMRQSGVVAAGALHALERHRERLSEDHENARRFAAGLAQIEGMRIDPDAVETNIIWFEVATMPASEFVARCQDEGVRMLPMSAHGVRAVTRLGVDREDVDSALASIRRVMRG